MELLAYIARDRASALAERRELATVQRGTALFADISGFSRLAEALTRALGQSAGSEALTRQINRCYDGLVAAVHGYGGSVVAFAGDAITCWFDADSGLRAAASASAMQSAMRRLPDVDSGPQQKLALKIAVAAGSVRRLCIGDPDIQRLDVMAGELVNRLAEIEQKARPGEILLAPEVVQLLDGDARISCRQDAKSPGSIAVMEELCTEVPRTEWPALEEGAIPESVLRPWVLRAIYERLQAGQSAFLAELRLATPLFVRFTSLDYDTDDTAGERLDRYTRWVQQAAAHYEGTLLQVSLGDKGSYLYLALGGPLAHEDDTERALRLALDLQHPPPEHEWAGRPSIGVSRGRLRAGAYGSKGARAYGIQGDEVNAAARLMQAARPGQILASAAVRRVCAESFRWESAGELRVHGIDRSLSAYRLLGREEAPRTRAETGPLWGRQQELARLQHHVDALREHGRGAVILIEGEPGIGKSRLLREVCASAGRCGVRVLRGATDPMETALAYHAWRPLFTALLLGEPSPLIDSSEQAIQIRAQLAPEELPLAPLLGAVLPQGLAESAGERSAERAPAGPARAARAAQTNAYLAALIARRARSAPLVLLIEDAHWMDSASWALVLELSQQDGFLLLLTSRPLDPQPIEYQRLVGSPRTERIRLGPLSPAELSDLIAARLEVRSLPDPVSELLLVKSQGNPLFAEALALALRDYGLLLIEEGSARVAPGRSLSELSIPDTVHGVITSRLDRLPPSLQLSLKIGSAIGRSFPLSILEAVFPIREEVPHLPGHLDALCTRDLLRPEPLQDQEIIGSYVYTHALVQDAAYQLMLAEQRWQVHRSIAAWYEQAGAEGDAQHDSILAYHYGLAAAQPQEESVLRKALHYTERAAEQAAARHACREAVQLFDQVLALLARLPEGKERKAHELRILLARNWPLTFLLGMFAEEVGANSERARALCYELGAERELLWVLNSLCGFYNTRAQHQRAQKLAEEIFLRAGPSAPPSLLAAAHYGLGCPLSSQGEFAAAQHHLQESIRYSAHIGTEILAGQPGIVSHGFLSQVVTMRGHPDQGLRIAQEGIEAARQLKHAFLQGYLWLQCAGVHTLREDMVAALQALQEVKRIAHSEKARMLLLILRTLEGLVAALAGQDVDLIQVEQGFAPRRKAGLRLEETVQLWLLGRVYLQRGLPEPALRIFDEVLSFGTETGQVWGTSLITQWQGEALLALDREEEAEARFLSALAIADRQGAELFALSAAVRLARLWHARGRSTEARLLLAPRAARFTEGRETALLREAARLLATLGGG